MKPNKVYRDFLSKTAELYKKGMICTALAVRCAHTKEEDLLAQNVLKVLLPEYCRLGGFYSDKVLGNARNSRDSKAFKADYKTVLDKITASSAEKGE